MHTNTIRNPRADVPVLIVGAGPVGLVLACELLQQGVAVRVVDSAPDLAAHSRAIVVWPRVLEVLRRVGIADHMVEQGHRLDGIAFHSGEYLLETVDMTTLPDTPYPFAVTIPQQRTEEILRTRLAELGGHVDLGVSLVALDNSGPLPVATLRYSDGTEEIVQAEYLVGADGAHSTTRRLLDVPFAGEPIEVTFAIGDGKLESGISQAQLHYCYSASGALGLAPLGGGVFRVAVGVPGWPDDSLPTEEFFQRKLDERLSVPATIGSLRWSTVFSARCRVASRFREGRCFLAGDAAHIVSAAGGQGMNTGIQDAVNLGWRLGGVLRGEFPASALDDYDTERRAAAMRIAWSTTQQTTWGLVRGRRRIAVRDTLFRVAGRLGAMRRTAAPLMSQLDVSYRPDGPAHQLWLTGSKRVRVGDRLPAFVRSDGDRREWPELTPSSATVLLWPGIRHDPGWTETCARVRDKLSFGVPILDSETWPWLREYLGKRPAAVVLRPDGHIAALTREVTGPEVRQALLDSGLSIETQVREVAAA